MSGFHGLLDHAGIAHDDVQRSAQLMGDVFNEGLFLLRCRLRLTDGVLMPFVLQPELLGGILDFKHVLVECLLHLGETVLQFSEGVGFVGVGDGVVVVAFSDLFGHVQQVHHGAGGLFHHLICHPQDQYQADDTHQDDNISQQVIVCQDLVVG